VISPDELDAMSLAEQAAYGRGVRAGERRLELVGGTDSEPPPYEFPPEAAAAPAVLSAEVRPPLDWSDLSGREPPDRRWAVAGWLGFGHTTLLVGSGGIGKTLMAQQLASCLAVNRAFIDEVRGPLKVLMWCCEDDADELWRRQIAISRWLDVGLGDFSENLHIVPRHGLENALAVQEYGKLAFTMRLEELRQQAFDLKADVVMLDNAAQVYGANANDNHQVTAFLNHVSGALPGLALMLLAHPARSMGSEFSGAAAWENVARTRLYLGDRLPDDPKPTAEDAPATSVRILARRKGNYAPKDIRRFNYENGVLVPEGIESGGGIVGHLRKARVVSTLLAAARRLDGMGIRVTDGSTSPNYLPRQILAYSLGEGATKRELAQALSEAMLDGKITRQVVGKYPNRAPMEGLKCVEE
jgi:hypothetical protein